MSRTKTGADRIGPADLRSAKSGRPRRSDRLRDNWSQATTDELDVAEQGVVRLTFHGSIDAAEPESAEEHPEPASEISVERAEQIALPHVDELEARFGVDLRSVEVWTGDEVREFLAGQNADAAAHGNRIFLANSNADIEIVAHEIVHVMQADRATGISPEAEPIAEQSCAEAEAVALEQTETQSPVEVSETLPPGALALRRSVPSTASPAPATDEQEFQRSLEENHETTGRETRPNENGGPAASADALDESLTAESNVGLEPQPTFELPEAPETELSAAEQAARQAELDAAQSAIENADDASGVVGAFADAPPSVKAAAQGTVGAKVDEVVQRDQGEFEGGIPEFHATMGGELDAADVPAIESPDGGPVSLEDGNPAPAPLPDLPHEPTPLPYRDNAGIVGLLSRLFGGNSADAIGQSLTNVSTSDDVETSPGDPPPVPLEGETDPQRVEDQNQAGIDRSKEERALATQAVMDGPGPEVAQLRQMGEVSAMGELAQTQVEPPQPAQGAERFGELELPEEVKTRFDQDQGPSMQESLAEARSQTESAEGDRDQQREETLATAEREQEAQVTSADEGQRNHVLEARCEIQTERQVSIDAQAAAVRNVEQDAETERAARQEDIQDRVRTDEEQIVADFDQADVDARVKVDKGETDAEAARESSEREAENLSWWDRAVNFVESAFAALTAAIGAIFDLVRSAVKGILDAVRDVVKGLIDLAANFIKGAIEAFGEALKGLVDGLIGDIFPGLAETLTGAIDSAVKTATAAVDVVADELKAGVDAIVDTLQAGLDAVLAVFQGAINAALAVLEAVITGDWGALFRKALEAVLGLLGINPEEFYAFVGRAAETFEIIIDDPLGFLGNLVESVKLGIQKFADNFLDHLRQGIIAWLTGALGDIEMPTEFNLIGVLDLARQVLGLTWDWVRQKAVEIIGEQNVERVEFAFSWIQTLITEGFPALFERLRNELGTIKDTVLEAIKSFLVEKVIVAGITWLVSLFNPVGALVKLALTIWNLYNFLRNQLARIIQVVQTVVEGIGNIARGMLDGAATRIEDVLANLLPVAIDLVASLLGLTGVAARVREIISSIRERVRGAITNVINRVLATFRGGGSSAAVRPGT